MRRVGTQRAGAHGSRGMLLAATPLAGVDDAADVRRGLALISVRLSDEHFDALVAAHGAGLAAAICGSLGGRATVVDMAFARVAGSADAVVAVEDLVAQYDVSRHEHVDQEQAAAEFASCFDQVTAPDGVVGKAMFVAYYIGVAHRFAADREFQLYVMRSWNLDRPAGAATAAAQLGGTNASMSSTQQRAMTGRSHPLYQTASGNIGTNLEQAFAMNPKNNRAGAFTKHAPTPMASTGLNTSASRTKV